MTNSRIRWVQASMTAYADDEYPTAHLPTLQLARLLLAEDDETPRPNELERPRALEPPTKQLHLGWCPGRR